LLGSMMLVVVEGVLSEACIDPERRAETLSIAEFDRLARISAEMA
jgi:16S rRNA A1518/A1519 N6-dimethyltransferase RsmA/KsgA/DIM1 with predicted DNA glycosylase/AP lyase activity